MKSLKVLLVAAALGASFAIPAQAADEKAPQGEGRKGGGGRGQSPEQMLERIEQAVGSLTADQKTKIKDIVEKNMAKMREASQEERRTLMQGQRDQIRAVLTAEQQAKFDAMPQGRGNGGGGGGGGKKKGN